MRSVLVFDLELELGAPLSLIYLTKFLTFQFAREILRWKKILQKKISVIRIPKKGSKKAARKNFKGGSKISKGGNFMGQKLTK